MLEYIHSHFLYQVIITPCLGWWLNVTEINNIRKYSPVWRVGEVGYLIEVIHAYKMREDLLGMLEEGWVDVVNVSSTLSIEHKH